MPAKTRRAIKTEYTGYFGTPVAWTAMFADYDLGDNCGTGFTEQEAIDDLLEQDDE
jgi:hypothetical protein